MSVYKSRPSPAPPNSKWDQILPFWAKNPNSGGADEGCVVLRALVAALHCAVRE